MGVEPPGGRCGQPPGSPSVGRRGGGRAVHVSPIVRVWGLSDVRIWGGVGEEAPGSCCGRPPGSLPVHRPGARAGSDLGEFGGDVLVRATPSRACLPARLGHHATCLPRPASNAASSPHRSATCVRHGPPARTVRHTRSPHHCDGTCQLPPAPRHATRHGGRTHRLSCTAWPAAATRGRPPPRPPSAPSAAAASQGGAPWTRQRPGPVRGWGGGRGLGGQGRVACARAPRRAERMPWVQGCWCSVLTRVGNANQKGRGG